MAPALEKPTKSLSTVLFLTVPGAGQQEWRGLAAQLIIGFWLLFPSHVSSLLVGQGVPLGIIVYERKPWNDKPRLQVPCRGRRPAGTAASATTLHRHDRASERMHVPVPASYFLPVVQPLPRFFLLCGLFLNRSSCLCAGFLRRKGTVQCVSPLAGVGGKGGEQNVEHMYNPVSFMKYV